MNAAVKAGFISAAVAGVLGRVHVQQAVAERLADDRRPAQVVAEVLAPLSSTKRLASGPTR